MRYFKKKKISFESNNAGGILGGISSGQDIIVSFAVKPTSSILSSRKQLISLAKIHQYQLKADTIPVLESGQCL